MSRWYNNNNMSAMIVCVFLLRDQHLFFAEMRYKIYNKPYTYT